MNEQMDLLKSAIHRRDEGMKAAAEHADRSVPGWGDTAYAAVCRYIAWPHNPPRFTTEDVRVWAKLEEPPDRRAWGAVMVRAVRSGLIRKVGYRAHRDPSRHKGVSTVWST